MTEAEEQLSLIAKRREELSAYEQDVSKAEAQLGFYESEMGRIKGQRKYGQAAKVYRHEILPKYKQEYGLARAQIGISRGQLTQSEQDIIAYQQEVGRQVAAQAAAQIAFNQANEAWITGQGIGSDNPYAHLFPGLIGSGESGRIGRPKGTINIGPRPTAPSFNISQQIIQPQFPQPTIPIVPKTVGKVGDIGYMPMGGYKPTAPAPPSSLPSPIVSMGISGIQIKQIEFTPFTSQQRTSVLGQPSFTPSQFDISKSMTTGQKIEYAAKKYTSADFWRDIGQRAFGGGQYQAPDIFTAFGKIGEPLDVFFSTAPIKSAYSGTGIFNLKKQTYEVPSQYNLTIQEIRQPYSQPPELISMQVEKGITTALQPRFETRAKEIVAGYQTKIDIGEIGLEQAQIGLKEEMKGLETEYQSTFQTEWEKGMSKRSYQYKMFGQPIETFKASDVLATGGTVAGFVFAPVTTGILTLPTFAGQFYGGVSEITGGIRETDSKRILGGGIQAGVGMLGTIGIVYGTQAVLGKQITSARIEDVLISKPRQIVGGRLITPEGISLDVSISTKTRGETAAYIENMVLSKPMGIDEETGKQFFKSIGTTRTAVLTTDYFSGKQIIVGGGTKFTGYGSAFPEGELTAGMISSERWTPSLTSISVKKQFDFSKVMGGGYKIKVYPAADWKELKGFYGGISKREGDVILFGSGKVKNYYIDKLVGKGFEEKLGKGFTFDIEDIGAIKVIEGVTPRRTISFENIIGGAKVTQIPSQTKQSYESFKYLIPSKAEETTAKVVTDLIKPSVSSKISTAVVPTVRSFGELGQIGFGGIDIGTALVSPPKLKEQVFPSVSQFDFQIQKQFQPQVSIQKQFQRLGITQRQFQPQALFPAQSQFQPQVSIQRQFQGQPQRLSLKLLQPQLSKLFQITPTTPTITPFTPYFRGFGWGRLPQVGPFPRQRRTRNLLRPQPKKYQPSLTESLLGKRGRPTKTLTGFEIRPMPLFKTKRKKTKRR